MCPAVCCVLRVWLYYTCPARPLVVLNGSSALSPPACPLRCRGGLNRRGRSLKGFTGGHAPATKKPQTPPPAVASLFEPCSWLGRCRTLACRKLRGSASDRSFGLRPRRTRLFLSRLRLTPPLNIHWVGWGGAQAFTREKIMPPVLSLVRFTHSLQSREE